MRFKRPLITSILLLSLSMLVVGAALAAEDTAAPVNPHDLMQDDGGDGEPVEGGVMPIQDCAECHLDITSQWEESPHAHAFDNPNYQEAVANSENPEECVECHVTGYVAATGEYAATNITCEACHGLTPVDHPPESVQVANDSLLCAQCHEVTHEEYFMTMHAAEGIECTDCHNIHAGTLHQATPQENCLVCHQDEIENFAHASHSEADLQCSDCHMFVDPDAPLPENGQGQRAHDFMQTTRGCLTCHEDLAEGTIEISTDGNSSTTRAAEYAIELAEAESELALVQNVRSTRSWLLLQGGGAGLVVGLAAAWILRDRLHGGRDDEES